MSLSRIRSQRELRTLRDGSPNFLHTFGSIVAGANEYIRIDESIPRARKYQPLMSAIITNNSSEFLDLELNGHSYARLPAGVIYAITDTPVWSLRLTNNDATNVASGEVTANLSTPAMGVDQLGRLETLYPGYFRRP
jgi:hypothetical protein